MALGDKLQAVKAKIYTKMGTQDAPITIRRASVTPAAKWGQDHAPATNSDVVIEEGCKVGFITARQTDAAGTVKVNDLRIVIPGNLVTAEQLVDAVVLYKSKTYTINTRRPLKIISGVATAFEIIARTQ